MDITLGLPHHDPLAKAINVFPMTHHVDLDAFGHGKT